MKRTLLAICFITFAVSAKDTRSFWFVEAAGGDAVIIAKPNMWPWNPKNVSMSLRFDEYMKCDGLNLHSDDIKQQFNYEKNNVDDFYVWIIKGVEVACLRKQLSMSVSYVAAERTGEENITYTPPSHLPSAKDLEKMQSPHGAVSVELRFSFPKGESVNFRWLSERSRIAINHSYGMVSAIFPIVNAANMEVSCYNSNGTILTPLQREQVVSDGIKFMSLKYLHGYDIKVCDFIKTDK